MRNTIYVLLAFLFLTQISSAQRLDLPEELFYYQPAAAVFGSEATWINPAGLSLYRASDAQVFAEFYKGDFAKSWGTVFTRDGFGVAYRKINVENDTDFKEYLFSGGMQVGQDMSFGLSYQYIKEAPELYNKKHLWNIGLLGTLNPQYRWGIVLSNLNNSTIDNIKTEVEMRYSLAYRPSGTKFTIAVDAFLSTKTKWRNADFIYNATFNPIPGLYVNGLIDSEKNFEIGFRVNFFKSFIGARRTAHKNGHHRGTTLFYGSTNKRQESIVKEKKRRLLTNISGQPNENPSKPFIGRQQQSYLHLLTDIYRAADDDSIDEMIVSLKKLSLGFAQAEELRAALKNFKSKKKRIICHLSYPNNLSYYVASVCDKIIIPPVSQLRLVGLKAELTFFAGTLEKLGAKVELLKIGDYKTAAETFTQETSSKANKEQINRLLDNLYEQFVADIALGRSLSVDKVKKLIDQGPFTSTDALDAGLVDGVAYLDELQNLEVLREYYPEFEYKSIPEITIATYHADTILSHSWEKKPVIAVIVAQGEVQPDGASSMFGSKSDVTPALMKISLRQAMANRQTKAILLRINSPGGAALAGEEIYHAFNKKSAVPMTVSMGNVAASGGYYFAMVGTKLFANRSTITGSIGIFGGKVDLSGLHEKLALKKELYLRGKYAGMMTTMKPFTTAEREKYFYHLSSMYSHFIELVAENRALPIDSIDNLGQGRVWVGSEAKQNGLIDEIGGFKDALDYIAYNENLSCYNIEIYPQKRPFIILPGGSLFSSIAHLFQSGSVVDFVDEKLKLLNPEQFYTRMPFDISIE